MEVKEAKHKPFLFPIEENILKKIISSTKEDREHLISNLRYDRIAGLFAIQTISTIENIDTDSINSLHYQIDKNIETFTRSFRDLDKASLAKQALQLLNITKLDLNVNRFNEYALDYLPSKKLENNFHLDNLGFWIPSKERDRKPLLHEKNPEIICRNEIYLPEQDRILRVALANIDDPIAIQGFSGTGKSTVGLILANNLERYNPLYLTRNNTQLSAVQNKLGGIERKTFNHAIDSALKARIRWGERNNVNGISSNHLAEYLGIPKIGYLKPTSIASALIKTVYNYCISKDQYISNKHLPYYIKGDKQEEVTKLAQGLWEQTILDGANSPLPILWFHKMKLLDNNKGRLSGYHSHIIIDEAQDLYAPMNNILNRSKQPTFRLFDNLQNLSGDKHRWNAHTRYKEMSHTHRQGESVTPLVNGIIGHSNVHLESSFSSSNHQQTSIDEYSKLDIPNRPCTIISKSVWNLLDICLRLSDASKKFQVIYESKFILESLLNDVIHLINDNAYRVSHRDLRNVKSWEQLINESIHSKVINRNINFLSSPQSIKAFITSHLQTSSQLDKTLYIVGLIENTKSLEFENTLITPDVFSITHKKTVQADLNKVYIAATRGKEQIFLPSNALEWLESIQ